MLHDCLNSGAPFTVWLELPLQLSLTKDQLAEHMFFSTGFKLNL